jgi:hypothetical protein
MPGTAELHNQMEVGEYVILEDLGLRGAEVKPLFARERPVVLEALTDLRLFLRFGNPPGRLDSYYIVHVISAQMQVEMRPWPLFPSLAACALLFLPGVNVMHQLLLSFLALGSFLGFARMRRVLEVSVVGGRQFRFGGKLPVLEGVAFKLVRQIKAREAHADTVYRAPPPIIFPPRAVPGAAVVKAVSAYLPPPATSALAAGRPPPRIVPPVPPIPAAKAAPPGRDRKFCHMCGQPLKRHSRFCPECGESQ